MRCDRCLSACFRGNEVSFLRFIYPGFAGSHTSSGTFPRNAEISGPGCRPRDIHEVMCVEMNEEKIDSLFQYRGALAAGDKQVFDKLIGLAKGHVLACAKADNLSITEAMLLAIVIEQQKRIEMMESRGIGC